MVALGLLGLLAPDWAGPPEIGPCGYIDCAGVGRLLILDMVPLSIVGRVPLEGSSTPRHVGHERQRHARADQDSGSERT